MENLNENWELVRDDNEELLHMKAELKIYKEMQKILEYNWVNWFFDILKIVDNPSFNEVILNNFLTSILKFNGWEWEVDLYSKSIQNKFGKWLDIELRKALLSITILLSVSRNNKNSIFLKKDHQWTFYKYDSNVENKLKEVWFEISPNFKDVECYSMYDDTINILLLWWNNQSLSEVWRITKEQLKLNQNIFSSIISYLYQLFKTKKEL